MNYIKHRNTKRNILNIKYSNYNLFIFIIIFYLIISSRESKNKINKLNLYAEIMIHIKGNGTQEILNKYSNSLPSEIIINNASKIRGEKIIDNLELEENNIKLIFNESSIDCSSMFLGLTNIITIEFIKFNTLSTSMQEMFSGCSNLVSLDLSNFNTSSITNMFRMFADCSNLISLDLSNFDTSSVTDMGYMFWGCSNFDFIRFK